MQRFFTSLGVIAGIFAFVFMLALVSELSAGHQARNPMASSTLSVVPSYTVVPLPFPSLGEEASSTPLLPKKTVSPIKKTAASSATVVPISAPVPAPSLAPLATAAELDASAAALRGALVNIICYASLGSGLHSISGSGVFIDPKGIILTNAHIAQYFLLADRGATCTVRAGSPAADRYIAALLYIPQPWLTANATVLTQAEPSGTGEYDFALLAVVRSTDKNPLPGAFPSLPLSIVPPLAGTPIVIASYGAQFLDTNQVQSALFPTIVFGSVKDVFTFASTTIDVLALGGSAAAQEGSSGGGVADASGKLVGTIMTSTVTGDTSTRSLNAITASYIRATYASETGEPIDLLLARPLAASILDFAQRIPGLESIITAQLH